MNDKPILGNRAIYIWLVVIGVAALASRSIYILMDAETLVTFLPDDPFYYFQLASNFISGKGSSIDGIHVTNGYHPLWMLVISPFFLLKSVNPILPVKLVLALSSLLSIAIAFTVYKIVETMTENKLLGLLGFIIYLFTRSIMFSDMQAEPSVLSNLLIAGCILIAARTAVSASFDYKYAITFGIVSGLAMLARTDNALFIALFFMLILFWTNGKKRYPLLAISAGIMFLVVLPWLIWNYANFGTIVQTSAYAIPFINRNRIIGDTTDPWTIWRIVYNSVSLAKHVEILFVYFPLKYLLVFVVGSLFGAYIEPAKKRGRGATLILLSTAVVFILYFLHTGVTFYLRDWHCAVFAVVTTLIIIYAVYLYARKPSILRNAVIVIVVLYITLFAVRLPLLLTRPPYGWQVEMYRGAQYINEHPDDKFAVYDGGIVSYFSDGAAFPIDGNINPDAHKAVVERRVYDYMKENGVDYLIGYGDWNSSQYGPYWPDPFDDIFEEVPNDLDVPGVTYQGDYSVYRLK